MTYNTNAHLEKKDSQYINEYPYFRTWRWNTTEVISTESTAISREPSLAVDSARNVHITWHDNTNYDGSGDDYDIFYKKTEEPPVFPEMTFNLPFSHRAIFILILISCNFVSLLIVKKRYKITK
ncbi:MAG: hypothetical protein ACTSSN_09980 [Candidatus Heimdallarchaeaceae archaeon]